MPFIRRIRLRVLAWLIGITLAAVGSIVLGGLPAVPLIGVAVAAAAVTVKAHAGRLIKTSPCLSCGRDLAAEPISPFGVACPDCGAVHQPRRRA